MTQTLFRSLSEEQVHQSLTRSFKHPGVLLFRARELMSLIEYLTTHPLKMENSTLDLGCGEGCIGEILFNKIDVGLDMSLNDVKEAKTLPTYKEVMIADARAMPFKSRVFDVVFSNSVIEHIKEIDQILEEVSAVLTDQGVFIFTVPSCKFSDYLYLNTFFKRLGLAFLGETYSEARNRQLNHFNLFDDVEWEKRLKKVSLDVVYRKYYLSHRDIYEWDKMCLLLRIVAPFHFIHQLLTKRFYKRVKRLLLEKDISSAGGGLLIVAKKRR